MRYQYSEAIPSWLPPRSSSACHEHARKPHVWRQLNFLSSWAWAWKNRQLALTFFIHFFLEFDFFAWRSRFSPDGIAGITREIKAGTSARSSRADRHWRSWSSASAWNRCSTRWGSGCVCACRWSRDRRRQRAVLFLRRPRIAKIKTGDIWYANYSKYMKRKTLMVYKPPSTVSVSAL